jgi:hypothetical protein
MTYSEVYSDEYNGDNDKSTNSYVVVSWLNNTDGKWLTPNLPLELMVFNFNILQKTNGSTYINSHLTFESPNIFFYSESILIEFTN